MRKVSDLLNKPAISAANGDLIGKVTGVLCGKGLKTIEYLNILKGGDGLNDYVFAAPRSVKTITDKTVVLTNNLCIKNAADISIDEKTEFPLGGAIYAADGRTVGVVADLLFGDSDKRITGVVTEEGGEISPERVSSFSLGIITLLPDGKTRKRKGAPKKMPIADVDTPVALFSEENGAPVDTCDAVADITSPDVDNETCASGAEDNVADAPSVPTITPIPLSETAVTTKRLPFMPARVIGNYRFLLGRVVMNNIYDKRNVLIIKKGTLITADVVLCAHANNKLVDLTLNSRL